MQIGESTAAAIAAAQGKAAVAAQPDSGKTFTIPGMEQPPEASTAAKAASAGGVCGVDAVVEAAARSRVKNAADEVAYLQQVSGEAQVDPVQQKKDEVLERLDAVMASSPESYVQVDEAVFQKMLDSADFAEKIGVLLKTIENHPWFTEDIPGLVSRFVYIGPDGECMVGIVREVSSDEEEESQIEMMLERFLQDSEDEMERKLYTFTSEGEKMTSLELAQQAIEMFIARRQALLEGLKDSDAATGGQTDTSVDAGAAQAAAEAGRPQAEPQTPPQAPSAELPPLVAV